MKATKSLDGHLRLNVNLKMRVSSEDLIAALAKTHGDDTDDAPRTRGRIVECYRNAVSTYGQEIPHYWKDDFHHHEGTIARLEQRYTEIVANAFPEMV